jgi:hypothetical protein
MRHVLHLEPGNKEAEQAAGRLRDVVEAEMRAGGITCTGVLDAVSLMKSDSSVSEDQERGLTKIVRVMTDSERVKEVGTDGVRGLRSMRQTAVQAAALNSSTA